MRHCDRYYRFNPRKRMSTFAVVLIIVAFALFIGLTDFISNKVEDKMRPVMEYRIGQ